MVNEPAQWPELSRDIPDISNKKQTEQTPAQDAHLVPAAQCRAQASVRNKPGCPKQEEVKASKPCLNLSCRLEQSEPTCNFIQTRGENNF